MANKLLPLSSLSELPGGLKRAILAIAAPRPGCGRLANPFVDILLGEALRDQVFVLTGRPLAFELLPKL